MLVETFMGAGEQGPRAGYEDRRPDNQNTLKRRLWRDQLVEFQRHHLRREIFSIFLSLRVRRLLRHNLSEHHIDT